MGADLYIKSQYKKNSEKYESFFNKWVLVRNSFPEGSEQQKAAQLKVTHFYNKMYEKGYFRDSYNDSSLFQMIGLSWWVDGDSMLDENGDLTPKNVKKLLREVINRKPVLEENLANKKDFSGWEEDKAEVIEYFVKKYDNFIKFLEEAIRLNESISCSI